MSLRIFRIYRKSFSVGFYGLFYLTLLLKSNSHIVIGLSEKRLDEKSFSIGPYGLFCLTLLLKRHPKARRVATGAYAITTIPSFTLWCTPTSVALIIWGLLTLRRDDVQAILNPDTDDAPEA